MNCKKCGSPIYHPTPNDLCPTCQGVELDKWILQQEKQKAKKPPIVNAGEKQAEP